MVNVILKILIFHALNDNHKYNFHRNSTNRILRFPTFALHKVCVTTFSLCHEPSILMKLLTDMWNASLEFFKKLFNNAAACYEIVSNRRRHVVCVIIIVVQLFELSLEIGTLTSWCIPYVYRVWYRYIWSQSNVHYAIPTSYRHAQLHTAHCAHKSNFSSFHSNAKQ